MSIHLSKILQPACLLAILYSCKAPTVAAQHSPPSGMEVTGGSGQGHIQDVDFKKPIKLGFTAPDTSYPEIAKTLKIEGTVELNVSVSPDGLPLSVIFVSGPEELRSAAIEYSQTIRFDRSTKASSSQPHSVTIGIIFKLNHH